MSGLRVHVEHVPDVDHLEENIALVRTELANLEEYGRDLLRALQDVEAELEATPDAAGAVVRRHVLAHKLRQVCRQLSRAQIALVPVDDERKKVAPQVLEWLDEAERKDRPWSAAA